MLIWLKWEYSIYTIRIYVFSKSRSVYYVYCTLCLGRLLDEITVYHLMSLLLKAR